MELINFMIETKVTAAHNTILQLVVVAVVFDTLFGILRAIKEKKFNSNVGINGAIRKISMLLCLVCSVIVDAVARVNLIGFLPKEVTDFLGLDTIGTAEFFAILFLAYEVVSILKNMTLCGLPVEKVWRKAKEVLGEYTDELPEDIK